MTADNNIVRSNHRFFLIFFLFDKIIMHHKKKFLVWRSSLVECVSVLHGTCLQSIEKKNYSPICVVMFVKKSQVHILYHKEIADARIIIWNRHGHECSSIWKLSGNFTLIQCIKKCRDFLGRDILVTTFV
jgi:hypothetical protein